MRECMAEGCPHLAADGCDYCHQHDEPPAVMPVSGPDYELVRVSRELLERLLAQDPQPVVLVGFDRHEDGTIDLIFREAQSAG